jgi:hypothetical protein
MNGAAEGGGGMGEVWRHRRNPNSLTHSPESGKSEIKETSLFTKACPPVLIAVDPVLVRFSKMMMME